MIALTTFTPAPFLPPRLEQEPIPAPQDLSSSPSDSLLIGRVSTDLIDLTRLLDDTSLEAIHAFIAENTATIFSEMGDEAIYQYLTGQCDFLCRPVEISYEDIAPQDFVAFLLKIYRGVLSTDQKRFAALEDLFSEDFLKSLPTTLSEEERLYIETGNPGGSPTDSVQKLRNRFLSRVKFEEIEFFRSFFYFWKDRTKAAKTIRERIYINGNPQHLLTLIERAIPELMTFREVVTVKTTNPWMAFRNDTLVIALGGDHFTSSEAVLTYLKELQASAPELFSSERVLFKQSEAPGIATIGRLSGKESFGKTLAQSIQKAICENEVSSIDEFREAILKSWFELAKEKAAKAPGDEKVD